VPALALVTVIALSLTSIGVLLAARNLGRPSHGGPVSGARTASPSPTSIFMPTDVLLSAPSAKVVWAYIPLDHVLMVSADQGNTWQQRSLPPGDGVFPSASFVNDREGWLLFGASPATQCEGQSVELWHTKDGAATWSRISFMGIADAQCKDHIAFIDAGRGFITAWDDNHRPTIYRTSNGGLSWLAGTLADPPGFVTQGAGFALHVMSIKSVGSAVLLSATSGRDAIYVFRSSDGGQTWTYIATVSNPSGLDLSFLTATHWLTVQAGVETNDAGKSWQPFATDYSDAAGVASRFVFADATVGYGTVRGSFHRTVDGGAHWVMPKTPWTQSAG
jgi:photosystem II stability/assembly factor-like uncharacterized protein